MGKIIIQYEDDVTAVTTTMIKAANSLLARYNQSAISGIAGPLTSAQVSPRRHAPSHEEMYASAVRKRMSAMNVELLMPSLGMPADVGCSTDL